jgi:ribonuclease PH
MSSPTSGTSPDTRLDGRTNSELRAVILEHGHLESMDGSCQFRIGDTCVIVSIVGPIADDSKQANTNKTNTNTNNNGTFNVVITSDHASITNKELYFEEQIRSTFSSIIELHKYPQTMINVHVQIIADYGSMLMAILNATSIALLDAGIDCNTFLTCVSCAIIQHQHQSQSSTKGIIKVKEEEKDDDEEEETESGSKLSLL